MNCRIKYDPKGVSAQWLDSMVDSIQPSSTNDYWKKYFSDLKTDSSKKQSVHLGIFIEPYLEFVLAGKKTIESRFSINRCAPFERVNEGDLLLIKESSGPVVAICNISKIWSYHLDPSSWDEIKSDFYQALCIQDPAFWKSKERATYATLMSLERVTLIHPLEFDKRDRRGWVVLNA